MTDFDAFRYDGKRALVVGAASGMGRAVAVLAREAGAEVVGMDHAPVDIEGVEAIHVNLAEQGSIDAAVAGFGGRVDALFSCAGVADGTPGIEKINFLGHRHMIGRMIDAGMLGRGSSIGFISSAAGLGWEASYESLKELLATPDFDSGAAWFEREGKCDYYNTKQAVCAYVASQAFALTRQGIRINAICPGPTDTPLAQANADTWLATGADFRAAAGVAPSTPEEQAAPLLFLCSDAATAITGQTLVSDAGWMMAGITETFPDATLIARILMGRISIDDLDFG
jgi:NAD(P)-dependent dehydrogenase (short-subunit alcohol dehydrogenase family)